MFLLLILLQAAAIITAPAPGDAVTGSVNITGTATHPQLTRYEVAFAYDPNPTDTWFELQPPSTNSVTDGVLAVWDTTRITDGNYMLRLRVYAANSDTPLETIVRNIQVQNNAPIATPTLPDSLTPTLNPTATLTRLDSTATPLPEPTATLPSSPTSPPSPSLPAFLDLSNYTSSFCNGVYLTLGAFVLLGIYVALRDRIRRPIRRWLRRIMSDARKP